MTFLWKILINEQHITHWKKKCILLSFVVAIYRKSLSDLNVSLCQIFIESDILIFVVINRMHVFLNILTSRKYNLLLSHVECRRRIQEFLKNSQENFGSLSLCVQSFENSWYISISEQMNVGSFSCYFPNSLMRCSHQSHVYTWPTGYEIFPPHRSLDGPFSPLGILCMLYLINLYHLYLNMGKTGVRFHVLTK